MSLSFRRENHSSERCGASDGMKRAVNTNGEGERIMIEELEETKGMPQLDKVRERLMVPCFLVAGSGADDLQWKLRYLVKQELAIPAWDHTFEGNFIRFPAD